MSSSSREAHRYAQGRIRTIEVEKIYPGFAIVLVDEKFRARLEPSMYNGPREYIKKGKVFRARTTITKINGITYISILDVLGEES